VLEKQLAAASGHRHWRFYPGSRRRPFSAFSHRNRRGGRLLLDGIMNVLLVYLLLLKATLTSFSGLASLPMVRNDFVVRYHVLTDRQLNTAVAAGRVGPGPLGIYVVSVGYLVAGIPGACAGWMAMITPAFLIIPMIRFLGSRAEHRRAKAVTRAVLLAGAGLLASASAPLARDAVTGPLSLTIVVASLVLIALTRIDSLWIMLGAAIVGLLAFQL
jgi:chromate transporter